MVMAVGAIGSYSSNFQDPEYIKVLKELMQMGITPSGNKNADVSKLKEAKTELIEKIQTKLNEEQKQELQVQPLEASKESQQAQQLEYAKTGAMTLAELNKLYFGLI